MRRMAVLLVATFMTACSNSSAPPLHNSSSDPTGALPPVELSPAQRADVEDGIRKRLKDPESARFGGMNAGISQKSADTYIVCGWVNSKNSFGGYVGDKPFIAMYFPKLKTVALIGMGGTDIDTIVVRKQCVSEGVPLGV